MSTNKRIEELLTYVIAEAEQEVLKPNSSTLLNEREQLIESYVRERIAQSSPELIEEGWKEIALAIGMLANVGLGTAQKAQAQQQLQNPTVVQQINDVLNNDKAMDFVVDTLEDQGFKDAEQKIEDNAEKVKDDLAKKGYKVRKKTATADQLGARLRQGYAITKVQSDTIYKEVSQDQDAPQIVDTISVELGANDFFQQGSYVLSDAGIAEVQSIINQIHQQDGTVLAVRIESSTDKQRVSPGLQQTLGQKGYSADNQGLSQARNDAVKQQLAGAGIDTGLIQQNVLYEQGSGELGAATPQDPSARYVKIIIDAVQVSAEAEAQETSVDTVTTIVNTFEVAKAYKPGKGKKNKSFLKINIKTNKAKSKVGKNTPDRCPVWGK